VEKVITLRQQYYKSRYDQLVNKNRPEIQKNDLVLPLQKTAQDGKCFHPKFKRRITNLHRVIAVEGLNLTLRELNRPAGHDILVHRDQVHKYLGTVRQFEKYLTNKQRLAETDMVCPLCKKAEAPATLRNPRTRKSPKQTWMACENRHTPLVWYHMECVGFKTRPTGSEKWFCPQCVNKPADVQI
jgi:hypothetical protein